MALFGKPKNGEAHRYYLLPGQGRGARKKFYQQLGIALAVGSIFSALIGFAMIYLNKRH
jgi:hypothetical protein